jgi:chemotaxis protein CheC
MQDCVTDNPKLAVLQQLLEPATSEASGAMSRWTDGLISLSLDEVRELPLEEVCAALELDDERLTMVVLGIEGDVGGVMILVFDEENGRQLAASLMGRLGGGRSPWDEMERSALTETGNILGCAYISAIARLIGCPMVPSAPYFIQDYGASVLQQALMVQASCEEQVLVCRTRFCRQGEQLSWHVLFVPTQAMREAMENACLAVSDDALALEKPSYNR